MNTGEKIRILRDMKGYSQDNMADMLGLSRQAYGDYERGNTKISDSRLKQIADALGTTPEAILNVDEHMGNFLTNVSKRKCPLARVLKRTITVRKNYNTNWKLPD
jgi:transcriptional regulator with XRE-family HTH domain